MSLLLPFVLILIFFWSIVSWISLMTGLLIAAQDIKYFLAYRQRRKSRQVVLSHFQTSLQQKIGKPCRDVLQVPHIPQWKQNQKIAEACPESGGRVCMPQFVRQD
jgi:hypothetical protein